MKKETINYGKIVSDMYSEILKLSPVSSSNTIDYGGTHDDIAISLDDGKPCSGLYYSHRSKSFFILKDGFYHHDILPSVIRPNKAIWYTRGMVNRIDGPAIIDTGGIYNGYTVMWYFMDKIVSCDSQQDFEKWLCGNL